MQGIIFALVYWTSRLEAAVRAGFKDRPVAATAIALAVLAPPFVLLPVTRALTLWMLILGALAPLFVPRLRRAAQDRLARMQADETGRTVLEPGNPLQRAIRKTQGRRR